VRQGGKPQPLTTLDTSLTENSHRHPHFLPDGDRFLFTARAGSAENNALYLGSLSTGTTRRLRNVESQAVYVGGHDGFPSALLYVREGTLFRHPFDGTQFTADPIPIADVEHGTIGVTASFAASRDGTVLVTRTGDVPTVPTWFTRDGAPDGVLPPGDYLGLRISPDGARGVFNRPDGKYGNRDTWLIDLKSFALQRLTNHPANDLEAVWSPDGRRVAFSTDRDGGPALRVYVKGATDVTAPEQPIPNFPQGDFDLMDWSSDGRWLGLHGHAAPYNDVMIVPMSGEAAFPLATTPFTEVFPRFSPDGKRVAFSSTVSGRSEIYVRPFTSAGSPGMPATQVSTGGAIFPVWSRTGGELYFLGSDSQLYAVATNSLSTPQSVPRVLFRPCVVAGQGQPYDVGPDGRFLVLCRGEAAAVVVTVGREATSSRLEH
jgi:Tol biopolymer transport system component